MAGVMCRHHCALVPLLLLLFLVGVGVSMAADSRQCTAGVTASRDGIAALARSLVGKTINYTQGTRRWSGITDAMCPPAVPPRGDCSSFVSWVFWAAFGKWPDYLNAQSWAAGYTGTMKSKGTAVATADRLPGDIVLYGVPTVSHVALYVGSDQVVTFGSGNEGSVDPINLRAWSYRTDINGFYRFADFFAVGQGCQ
jgi:cell wall-associated NlpC family hydrolase